MTNKKILFTGGNGFIGRQVIPFIQEAGYEVVRPRSSQVRLEVDEEVEEEEAEVGEGSPSLCDDDACQLRLPQQQLLLRQEWRGERRCWTLSPDQGRQL